MVLSCCWGPALYILCKVKQISQEEKKILKRKQLVLGAAFLHNGSATIPVCGLMLFPRPNRLFSAELVTSLQQCCGRIGL